jgi:carbon storage regulator
MLVLSRKLGEKIYISDNICITVVDIDRGKIRLGIEAPREVPIFRQELLTGEKKAARTEKSANGPANHSAGEE